MVDSVSPSPKALVCCPSRLIRQFRRVLLGSPYARSWIFEAELYSSPRTPSHTSNLRIHLTYAESERVTDGARTRDLRSHNPMLCQLSYGHHAYGDSISERVRSKRDAGRLQVCSV